MISVNFCRQLICSLGLIAFVIIMAACLGGLLAMKERIDDLDARLEYMEVWG